MRLERLKKRETHYKRVSIVGVGSYLDYSTETRDSLMLSLLHERVTAHVASYAGIKISHKLIYIHPSYREAFGTALSDKNRYNLFSQNIFSRVLLKLVEKDENTRIVAQTVLENFYSLSEDIRDRLLHRLTEKDETAEDVAWVVATFEDFDELPDEVRSFLIDKLQKKLRHLIAYWAKGFPGNKIAALSLIWRARGKINKRFALNTLQKLSSDKDKKVKSWAIELLSTFDPSQKWRRNYKKHT